MNGGFLVANYLEIIFPTPETSIAIPKTRRNHIVVLSRPYTLETSS